MQVSKMIKIETSEVLEVSVLYPKGSYVNNKKSVSFKNCEDMVININYNYENTFK